MLTKGGELIKGVLAGGVITKKTPNHYHIDARAVEEVLKCLRGDVHVIDGEPSAYAVVNGKVKSLPRFIIPRPLPEGYFGSRRDAWESLGKSPPEEEEEPEEAVSKQAPESGDSDDSGPQTDEEEVIQSPPTQPSGDGLH